MQDGPPEESLLGRSGLLKASAKNQLLGRIAEALQVPEAVLYNPPNAVDPQMHATAEAALSIEGAELLRAYMRISDPEERRRILALVKAAAERA
ncbi:hypothetical protein [Methylobacterium longum]|uniref:Transcriptional regulator n=1 Tax=Methylobacterium longum TaxID=767694 RepID=A0ABT8AI34_9HYPH|nr:hypothetical protein [Methylobacterium longum]MDN3569315.1 hypothetical protein [Methylobacterium longum]GJE14614.1 hypothetical protein FOHLNKBM_5689 [Methylobacterium longum]